MNMNLLNYLADVMAPVWDKKYLQKSLEIQMR